MIYKINLFIYFRHLSQEVIERTHADWQLAFDNGLYKDHLLGLQKAFQRKDPTFIDRNRFNYHNLLRK